MKFQMHESEFSKFAGGMHIFINTQIAWQQLVFK